VPRALSTVSSPSRRRYAYRPGRWIGRSLYLSPSDGAPLHQSAAHWSELACLDRTDGRLGRPALCRAFEPAGAALVHPGRKCRISRDGGPDIQDFRTFGAGPWRSRRVRHPSHVSAPMPAPARRGCCDDRSNRRAGDLARGVRLPFDVVALNSFVLIATGWLSLLSAPATADRWRGYAPPTPFRYQSGAGRFRRGLRRVFRGLGNSAGAR
jgi:hypothetical protein